jgi:hypothetical protein
MTWPPGEFGSRRSLAAHGTGWGRNPRCSSLPCESVHEGLRNQPDRPGEAGIARSRRRSPACSETGSLR